MLEVVDHLWGFEDKHVLFKLLNGIKIIVSDAIVFAQSINSGTIVEGGVIVDQVSLEAIATEVRLLDGQVGTKKTRWQNSFIILFLI